MLKKTTMQKWTPYLFLTAFVLLGHFSSGQAKDTIYAYGDIIVLKRDTAIRNLITQINFKNYYGKTVDEFLRNDTVKTYVRYRFTQEPIGKLLCLNLTYAPGMRIRIYPVLKNGQASQVSSTGDFDFNAVKKEKIELIEIEKDEFEDAIKKHSKKK